MIRILFFIFLVFNFSNANDFFKPLFPQGEKVKDFILNSPLQPINSLMSHSGDVVITLEGGYFTKLRIWSIEKKKIVFQLANIETKSNQLKLSKNDRYLVYDDLSYIVLFDMKKRKIKKKIKINKTINSFDISDNGKYIVISSVDTLMLYDINKNKFLYKQKRPTSIQQIIISKTNDYFTLLTDKYIQLIKLQSGEELSHFSLENIKKIDISKDEKFIVAISDDTIYKLNILDKQLHSIPTKGSLEDIKVLNNKLIVTAGTSHLYGLNVWNLETKKKIYTMNNMGELKNISLSSDNRYLSAIQEYKTALYIINMFNLKIQNLNRLKNTKKAIYSKKSEEIFSIENDKKGIKVWDLKEHRLKNILDSNSTITDIVFNVNKQLLVSSSVNDNFEHRILLWDVTSKKKIFSFQDRSWNIGNVAINKNNNLIAYSYGYSEYKIKIFDVNKSVVINEIPIKDYIRNLRFLDNQRLVISSYDSIKVVDIRDNRIINEVKKDNSYLKVYSNPNFYLMKDYSKRTYEVRDVTTNKKVFSTEENIEDIVGNLVFINDYKKGKVWDLKQKKYFKKLKENFYSVYAGEKIILKRLNDNRILNRIFYKKNNHWLLEDSINNKVYRYMNKNFYLNSKTLNPIISTKSEKVNKDDIDIFVTKNELECINYQVDTFNIQIENLSDKPMYDISFKIDDQNFSIVYDELLLIKSHAIEKIPISIQFNNELKNSFNKEITLEVFINGISKKIPLKVNVIKKDLKELEIESLSTRGLYFTKDNVEIKINNLTDYDLKNINITIYYHNKTIMQKYLSIDGNTSKELTFTFKKDAAKDGFFNAIFYKYYDNDFNVTLQINAFKYYNSVESIEISFQDFHIIFIIIIFFLFIPLFFIYEMVYLKKYNRKIKKIENNPSKIFEVPLHKLPYYKKILKRRNENNYEVYFSDLLENDLDRVSNFFEVNNEDKVSIVSDKVHGKLKQLDNDLFEIKLDKNFAIKVEKILLYFVQDLEIEKITKTVEKEQSTPILLIDKNEKEQKVLSENNKLSELKNVIVILPINLKIFLLEKNSSLFLSKILSMKLDRKLISPYNVKGGVHNESYFFGREKIINNIVNRELSNYLIVGARQIGKTSLLNALERIFVQRDEITTIHITLGTNNIIKKIALNLKLDRKSSLEDIEEYILTSSKTYLFLIDEVDGFIKSEESQNYKILNTLRSLTQERKAYFIMAGFWELYAQATYDYQSPIKNFGEIITIDKLEDDACVNLVLKPMEALNLSYKNLEEDAVYMIQSLGKRANLIASVANKIVENLEPLRYEINREDIDKALEGRNVIDSFYSWRKLTDNEFKSYIDRFIVYYTVGLDCFTIRHIISFFKEVGVEKVTIEEIKESLDRLELSYILVKEEENYFYTIPLFQEHLQKEDTEAILNEMINEFRRFYNGV